jgi:recombination protein RecA
MPAFTLHCEELGICAIFLNQIRTKIGVVYGDPRTTPGGDAPKFYASQRVMLSAKKITKGTDTIGTEVTALVIKNKIARPFLSAQWRFVFQADGSGKFDTVRSTIDFLDRLKLFEKSGNYIVWKGTKLYPDALAKRIEAENQMDELLALLPRSYKPDFVAEAIALGSEETDIAAE